MIWGCCTVLRCIVCFCEKENSLLVREFLTLLRPIYCTATLARWHVKSSEAAQLSLLSRQKGPHSVTHGEQTSAILFYRGDWQVGVHPWRVQTDLLVQLKSGIQYSEAFF